MGWSEVKIQREKADLAQGSFGLADSWTEPPGGYSPSVERVTSVYLNANCYD